MARVKLDQALDFDAAEHQIKEALARRSQEPRWLLRGAGLALRDMDITPRRRAARSRAGYNPGNLELLSMKAAVRFLADDRDGLREAKTGSLRKEPRVSRAFTRSSASSPSGSIATTKSSR